MEKIPSYVTVKNAFTKEYASLLLEVIYVLSGLRDEIQEVIVMQKAGSVAYSFFGIVGEVVALGGVIATPLGTVGVGLWMISSALNILHENVKLNIVKKNLIMLKKV